LLMLVCGHFVSCSKTTNRHVFYFQKEVNLRVFTMMAERPQEEILE